MAEEKQPIDREELERELVEQNNLLRTDRLDLSFGEIISMYERNEIIIKPAFQRYFRWTEEQQTRFIESILLGIPIPPIFVATDSEGVWELVDGLQRLSTILSFVGILRSEDEGIRKKNNWILLAGDRVEKLEGFTYTSLPNKFRLNLKRATCRVEILRWNSSYDMRYELFNRLNTGGTPLTQQEIRNCIFRDISPDFNNFLKKLSKNQDFIDLVALSEFQNEQLYNEELILRFLSLYKNEGGIRTSISQHMTLFMESALKDISFNYNEYEAIFNEVFRILNPLGKNIFRQKDGAFATALYDVITFGIANNISIYKQVSIDVIIQKIDEEVRKDETLLRFSRRGGNNQKTRITNRLREAKRIFGK